MKIACFAVGDDTQFYLFLFYGVGMAVDLAQTTSGKDGSCTLQSW
jgi:hypothetical protein